MSCQACGKDHPPEQVTWSEGNPSQQPRPYHCPHCSQTYRADKKARYWTIGPVSKAATCSRHGPHPPATGCCLEGLNADQITSLVDDARKRMLARAGAVGVAQSDASGAPPA